MAEPLVTVGVTAFNAQDTIEAAIRSALAQDWRCLEVLVVDDASTDATPQKVTSLQAEDPRIQLISHTVNKGVAESRNSILRHAQGDFVAFFDDDDESAPQRLAAQVERIITYERLFPEGAPVICHTARRQLFPDGSSRIETTMGTGLHVRAPSGPAVAARILQGKPLRNGYGSLATCSQMARLSTYRAVGGFDPTLRRSEDTDLAVRLALNGAHFLGIAEPLVTQTMHVTDEKSLGAERQSAAALLRKHQGAFTSKQDYAFAQEWLTLKFLWLAGDRRLFWKMLLRLAGAFPLSTVRRMAYALPMAASRASVRRLHDQVQKATAAGRSA
ncbi:glycosyltransferase [Phenylobacterium sp.]|jgi:glycosyltransferase involved in cell wall biosynthesis|uniref:glycosyltransferase n=1 Tax=Phenylobacterium sp. TaxID=1871053 RepID=UPI002F936317